MDFQLKSSTDKYPMITSTQESKKEDKAAKPENQLNFN